MINKILYTNKEDICDLMSILTYSINNHPSHDLRQSAKRLLNKIFQPDMFEQDGYRPPA